MTVRTCSGRLRMLNQARAVKAVDALRGSCSNRMRHAKAANGPITCCWRKFEKVDKVIDHKVRWTLHRPDRVLKGLDTPLFTETIHDMTDMHAQCGLTHTCAIEARMPFPPKQACRRICAVTSRARASLITPSANDSH